MAATIRTGASPTELWHELVREGEERAHAQLAEDLESYLVFTLMRHLADVPLAHRVMALEMLEALLKVGRRRADELRDVGDRCLLIAGLYPELAERRRVSLRYFVSLGQGAYDQLGQESRAALGPLYGQLARCFSDLVRVLIEVRKLSGEWQGLTPLARLDLVVSANESVDPARAQAEFPDSIVVVGSTRAN